MIMMMSMMVHDDDGDGTGGAATYDDHFQACSVINYSTKPRDRATPLCCVPTYPIYW